MTHSATPTLNRLEGAFHASMGAFAEYWDEGYEQGVRDEARDMERADNPYRNG